MAKKKQNPEIEALWLKIEEMEQEQKRIDDTPDPLEGRVSTNESWLAAAIIVFLLFVVAPFLFKWVPVAGKWVFCSNYEYRSETEKLESEIATTNANVNELFSYMRGINNTHRLSYYLWYKGVDGEWITYEGGIIAENTEVIYNRSTYITLRPTSCSPDSCSICYKKKE